MRVLVTGGSGFIAAHVLDVLLEHGHSVVTTVRSREKGNQILKSHGSFDKDKLDFVLVQDMAEPEAFDAAVVSNPPFNAVIHTASPFHFNVDDVEAQMLKPAIVGTTGILKSIQKYAPTVSRVVITSSFAALMHADKHPWPEHTYSEADWNPITREEAFDEDRDKAYCASKTFAERAAWDFMERERPNFTLSTMCPPLVLGPVVHYLNSLESLNTSNERIRDCTLGLFQESIPFSRVHIFIDVRDMALCHVLAIEKAGAENKRFFTPAGYFSNRDIATVIWKHFPELRAKLPDESTPGGGYPDQGVYKIDNSRVTEVLGITFRSFEECIIDTVKSFKAFEKGTNKPT